MKSNCQIIYFVARVNTSETIEEVWSQCTFDGKSFFANMQQIALIFPPYGIVNLLHRMRLQMNEIDLHQSSRQCVCLFEEREATKTRL